MLEELISPVKQVLAENPRLEKLDDKLYVVGTNRPMPTHLTSKILDFIGKKYPVEYLINFWLNCLDNPEPKVIEDLFEFLEAGLYPITEEGNFLAYKKVTSHTGQKGTPQEFEGIFIDKTGMVRYNGGRFVPKDIKNAYLNFLSDQEPVFVDSHTKKIQQKIGETISMPREDCDFNRNNLCSTGFHFGSYEYSKSFSGDVFIYVSVNPKDVTSIPREYNMSKGRCCQYTIVGYATEAAMVDSIVDTRDEGEGEESLFDRDNF